MTGLGHPHVELGMYPFDSVAWAWDEIWTAVHRRVPWTPAELTRSGDVHARWDDPDCVVTHVCGYPFASQHRHDLDVVGAFALDIPEAEGATYRSIVFGVDDRTIDELLAGRAHAVVNSEESLSGWLSLLAATVGAGHPWPGEVTFSGSHRTSMQVLAAGGGDLTSIDSWTVALVAEEQPGLVAGLRRIGLGPPVPTPAIAARRTAGPGRVGELRAAFREALADPATQPAQRALRITGFVERELGDYLPTLALGPIR
ncbi:MAG TPA: PhnD/SsuA/transferrin family substrate-binding protein [Ilumatobacter sp.]